MVFPRLPETCMMYIFASIVHHLRTNDVNVYISKIYLSGLIFRGSIYGVGCLMLGMLIGLHIWGHMFGGAYIQGAY